MWPERDFLNIIRTSLSGWAAGARIWKAWNKTCSCDMQSQQWKKLWNANVVGYLFSNFLTSLKFHSIPWRLPTDTAEPWNSVLFTSVLWSFICLFLLKQITQPYNSLVSGPRSHFSKVQRSSCRYCFIGMLISYIYVICFHYSFE